jgi:hypothetical protein
LAAYRDYTSLSTLPKNEVLPDGTYVDNEDFICKGLWGRFLYFGILKEFRTSAIQVYECALRFPNQAIKLFDSSFFPQIDCSQLSELCENLERINHNKPLIGLYENMPYNMAKALIEMQIKKYKDEFMEILTSLKMFNYE